ncbi:MAG: hypothetical protein J6Y02_06345 [Pseudobutyrivibrio sp.]|nr:hypothetical protein [Pseudobutyrivibrio sp.]
MDENVYQRKLIKKIKEMIPGCIVMKNDPNYIQGIPDLTILHGKRWATLEVKKSEKAEKQTNQPEYVERMNKMSFSSFIYPENEKEVLDALQQSLQPRRSSRSVRSK